MTSNFTRRCVTVTLVPVIFAAAATGSDRSLQSALEHSGENRSELETALRKVKGRDTEYLISHERGQSLGFNVSENHFK